MYDPFAHLPPGYRYEDHQDTVTTLVQCWLNETDTRLIAIPKKDPNLALARQLNPGWFTPVGTMAEAGWTVEGVAAPSVPAAACEAARSAIP